MNFTIALFGITVGLVALGAWVGHKIFASSRRGTALPQPEPELRRRKFLSKILSGLSYFAILATFVGVSYRRTYDLYAAELSILWLALPLGLLAACANRYFYKRWI